MEALPTFKYHPDPVATGSVVEMSATCRCCKKERSYMYSGAVEVDGEYDNNLICPWCIADGSANKKFEYENSAELEGDDAYDLSDRAMKIFSERTPGFAAWQSERWFTCCGDVTAFLGLAGKEELTGKWAEAVPMMSEETGHAPGDGLWEEILDSMHKTQGPIAYVFQCLKCKKLQGYWDCH